ncbi:glycosyltransferase [Desertihabitans aurantiacus]|uniref:glycosyltransferase n=1 Tax=Desertihabitans aurantiacus TaxID=2282477 RepID=UPI000DF7CC55|nr:nucleotide disphospho-sugar-binding domain-containing protein [Desertihabitans aurantiacus]
MPMTLLLCATPLYGHVSPVLAVGRRLRERGHRVLMLTGARFAEQVARSGLTLVPLPAAAEPAPPPVRRPGSRVLAARGDILSIFVDPLGAQHAALQQALEEHEVDAVLSDTAFLGVLPLTSVPPTDRVPVLGLSVTPLSLVSVDCAPFGSGLAPGSSWFTRMRNGQANWLVHHGPFRRLHQRLDAVLAEHGVPPGAVNFFDQTAAPDLTFHLGLAELEYPRREMPATIRFVGPVRSAAPPVALPPWWHELEDGRPVVHVTQGTLDNADLTKLVAPTVTALAGEDVLVVVSTGGRPVEEVGRALGGRALPGNVRVATFLPYHQLLPHLSVMVTNGGYGGVHEALRHGVPLVVGGDSEDKPEVAARVAWAGVGRTLRTGRPTPRRVGRAVRAVLAEDRYRAAARTLGQRIAELGDPADAVGEVVETLGRRSAPAGSDVDLGASDVG